MGACNSFYFGEGHNSAEALFHLSRAFTLVNERLNSDQALADSTLGMVLMLMTNEKIRMEAAHAQIHFGGLRKMVQLRGGLDKLEGNPGLYLKILKSVWYSVQNGGDGRI